MLNPSALGIFFTNDMNFNGDAALFPTIARANHSCVPNADFISRPSLGVQDDHLEQVMIAEDGNGEGQEEEGGSDTEDNDKDEEDSGWFGFGKKEKNEEILATKVYNNSQKLISTKWIIFI